MNVLKDILIVNFKLIHIERNRIQEFAITFRIKEKNTKKMNNLFGALC